MTVEPKYKIDRRYGINLWGRPKSPQNLRPYRPGQHGKNFRKKISGYGAQLAEKQKLRTYYALREKQFRRFFKNAAAGRGNVAELFIGLLEEGLMRSFTE